VQGVQYIGWHPYLDINMLQKLLDEIREGGTLEPTQLALRLDTTPEMIKTMLDHLAHLGILRENLDCPTEQCSGCELQSSCHQPVSFQTKIWGYTQKRKDSC